MVAVTLYKLNIEFRQQEPFCPYFADFFLPEVNLIIECDGAEFHLDKEKDARRDAYILANHGVRTIRLTGSDIVSGGEGVVWAAFQGRKIEQYNKVTRRRIESTYDYCPFRKGYYDQYGNEQHGT
jgi:very-short-patch-repair endonuclease